MCNLAVWSLYVLHCIRLLIGLWLLFTTGVSPTYGFQLFYSKVSELVNASTHAHTHFWTHRPLWDEISKKHIMYTCTYDIWQKRYQNGCKASSIFDLFYVHNWPCTPYNSLQTQTKTQTSLRHPSRANTLLWTWTSAPTVNMNAVQVTHPPVEFQTLVRIQTLLLPAW